MQFYIIVAVLEFVVKYKAITHYIARFGMRFSTAWRLVNRRGLTSPCSHKHFTPAVQEEWSYGELTPEERDHLALQNIFQPVETEAIGISGRAGLYLNQIHYAPKWNTEGCNQLDRMFWEEHQMIGTGRYKRFKRLEPSHETIKPLHHRMEFWHEKIECTDEQARRLVDAIQGLELGFREVWSLKAQLKEDVELAITYFEVIASELFQLTEEVIN